MNKMNKTLAAAMSAALIICTLAGCNTQTTTQVTSETTTASTTSREHENMLEDVINQTFETTHAWTEPTSEISETEETTTCRIQYFSLAAMFLKAVQISNI